MFGKPGDQNPNWRGGKTFCSCGARKKAAAKTCAACRDRTGESNPFYGKTHTEEVRLKLSQLAKNREKPHNIKKVVCAGVLYESMKEAAYALGVAPATITYRVKNTSASWKDYYYYQE